MTPDDLEYGDVLRLAFDPAEHPDLDPVVVTVDRVALDGDRAEHRVVVESESNAKQVVDLDGHHLWFGHRNEYPQQATVYRLAGIARADAPAAEG